VARAAVKAGGAGLVPCASCARRVDVAHPQIRPPFFCMNPFIWLILTIIGIYKWIVIAMVIMSWLLAFNVVNIHHPFVRQVTYFLTRLTEPLLAPIRRILPNLGGLDLSPVVLFIALLFIERLIIHYLVIAV
jgi:YggT family protein